ncbi:MAG: hypothetical protein ACTSQ8_23555 [Candidatus Helarchaeota archaeon]
MPIVIPKKRPPNPLNLRNRPKRLGTTIISVSMPLKLKLALDAMAGKQERSGLICKILQEWLQRKKERDPRFLLQEKKRELVLLKTEMVKLKAEIKRLEIEAQEKMKELLE